MGGQAASGGGGLCPPPPRAACAPVTPRAFLPSLAAVLIPADGSCQSDEPDFKSEIQKTTHNYFTSLWQPASPALNHPTPIIMASLCPLLITKEVGHHKTAVGGCTISSRRAGVVSLSSA